MCATSMVGDVYRDKWNESTSPYRGLAYPGAPQPPAISRAEFDALKKEVADMKELLKRAKDYDERNGEPECEMDDKMDLLRRVAKLVGISLDDVIGSKA
jgi:hypothetical protein